MKMVIFGATGRLGLALTRMALEAGHKVTVLVRTPSKLIIEHRNLNVVQGDVLHQTSVDQAVKGQELIFSALGVGKSTKQTEVFSTGTRLILEAAGRQHIKRFIGVSSAGVEDHPSFSFFYRRIIRPLLLKHVYRDMAEMERIVRGSKLNWTLIQPYTLTDGPLTETYRTKVNDVIPDGKNISRADVAHLMLNEARKSGGKMAIAISY